MIPIKKFAVVAILLFGLIVPFEASTQINTPEYQQMIADSIRLDSVVRASHINPHRVPANFRVGKPITAFHEDSAFILGKAWRDVYQLTSKEFAGRGYQRDGHIIAAKWIAEQFRSMGLTPVNGSPVVDSSWFQKFRFTINLIDSASLAPNGKYLTPGSQYIVNAASGRGEGKKIKVSYVGYGLPDDQKKFKGGVALMREGLPEYVLNNPDLKAKYSSFAHDQEKAGLAIQKNAEAVIILKKKLTADFSIMPMEQPYYEVLDSCWPAKVKTVDFNLKSHLAPIWSQNVIGVVKGKTWPDSVVIVSAHYDHLGMLDEAIFPGANDNASGVAMMLSLARHFSRPEFIPEFTMVFIAFGGEETGLIGSKYYAEKDPRFPLVKTKFILNLDLLGNGDEGIVAVAGAEHPVQFNKLSELNQSQKAVPLVKQRSNAPNSDHYYFVQKGVKGFFIYTLGGPPHYHDVNDIAENLKFSKFYELNKLFISFLVSL